MMCNCSYDNDEVEISLFRGKGKLFMRVCSEVLTPYAKYRNVEIRFCPFCGSTLDDEVGDEDDGE